MFWKLIDEYESPINYSPTNSEMEAIQDKLNDPESKQLKIFHIKNMKKFNLIFCFQRFGSESIDQF